MQPIEILKEIRKETSEIILFHSLAGKDSIMLIDLCSQIFDKVHCIYMYVVKDLEHMSQYKHYFEAIYKNCIWYETEHFAKAGDAKKGYLGCKPEPKRKLNSLAKITNEYKAKLGLFWAVFGSKQNDGLSRRLQLRTYEFEAVDRKGGKVYPLSRLSNKEVLAYIRHNELIEPLNYGDHRVSQSNDIMDPIFLTWCKKNAPEDYQKIIAEYPDCEVIVFRYENKSNNRDK